MALLGWFQKALAFVVSWIPLPSTAPISPGSPPPQLSPLAQVILAYNNGKAFFAGGVTAWSVPAKGVTIHKISAAQAQATADAIEAAAQSAGLPMTYVLACLAVESVLDPNCVNGNLGPGESNTQNDSLGYDLGLCQFKARYLVGSAPGVTDAATAYAFAYDVTRAVPYFCREMSGRVAWANQTIAANTSSAPDPKLSNPLLLGTGAYNFGETGMLSIYESGQFPTHCASVLSDEQYFAQKLGVPSVFAGL